MGIGQGEVCIYLFIYLFIRFDDLLLILNQILLGYCTRVILLEFNTDNSGLNF